MNMKAYGVNELRRMFLEFFEKKGHLKMNSFSLVPHNDNSLLIINSGMAPLKPYFTGQEIPPSTRVCTCQKCIRTGDIDNVGKTARHGTFFEMLGNFSFGDYFKEEAIPWAWEFLTETVGIPADRLYPSVYVDDNEAYEIWNKKMNISPARIFKFGKEDNFWEHGSGPCGPCTEIYFDRGEKYGCGKPTCTVGCDCDRYMEVWNVVFSQFNNDGKGHYTDLEQKNIDTGMGLERLAVAVQDVDSIFDVDTLLALRNRVCEIAGKKYKENEKNDISIRVITDHIRSATFMISDGIMPSNEGRGYVLRRIIRRADRHGKLLGIDGAFLVGLAKAVIAGSKDGYPELAEKQDFILSVIEQEEEKFEKTINQGLEILDGIQKDMEAKGVNTMSGEDAFKLYDTYGFPIDLTKEILEEKGMDIDEEAFKQAMKVQKDTARNARKTTSYMGADATVYEQIDPAINSEFIGYDKTEAEGKIVALVSVSSEEDGEESTVSEALTDGMTGAVITDVTPFYATKGGQVGDVGVITLGDSVFEVKETIPVAGSKIAHIGGVVKGMFKVGDKVVLKVDGENRMATCRNHSATHLLQKALREVLGTHVEQSGSYQDAGRTRFDFSHFKAMTPEEIKAVERLVNDKIAESLPVDTKVMSIEDAKKSGAMALFGEKYGDEVRVVGMGEFSKEFCGGTHVKNTGMIGQFKIISESGVAAGIRRIEAITGHNVIKYYENLEHTIAEAAKIIKASPDKLVEKAKHLMEEMKALQSENESLKNKAAKEALGDVMDKVVEIGGVKVLSVEIPDTDGNELRNLGDELKNKLGEGLIFLASAKDGKVNLVAMATDGAVKAGVHAGNLIKAVAPIVGGGGGGRPNMAQAGGKLPDKTGQAVEAVKDEVKKQLGA